MAIGKSLRGAIVDIGLPGEYLSSIHFRARIDGKQTGPLGLRELEGATTGMCANHSWSYGVAISNAYTSFGKMVPSTNAGGIAFPTGDQTEVVEVSASSNTGNEDGYSEIRYPGYCDQGTYKLTGKAELTGIYTDRNGPWNVAVVCNTTSWLNGGQIMPFYQEGDYTNNFNDTFDIAGGWPYVTLICYQLVRISHGAYYNQVRKSIFTNMRLRKL